MSNSVHERHHHLEMFMHIITSEIVGSHKYCEAIQEVVTIGRMGKEAQKKRETVKQARSLTQVRTTASESIIGTLGDEAIHQVHL